MLSTLQQLYPTASKEQIERNQKSLIQAAINNGYIDEDEPDSEGVADSHLEEFDKANDR